MNKITIESMACKRCGYAWLPRTDTKPRVCPKCHSAYWESYGKIGNQKHEDLVAKYVEEYETKGCRVIEAVVLPDLIVIDWERKSVTAIEVETNPLRVRTKLKQYIKRQPNFDHLLINGKEEKFKKQHPSPDC